jgi:dihydrofolate reductase
MNVTVIAAVARNGVIGDGRQMPWHLPEDLKHFRQSTQGRPVVMGRRTWESLPERFRPLPGRLNIVVTRQADWRAEGAVVVHSLDEAIEAAERGAPDATGCCVIGGAQLYAEALPYADHLVLTEIDRDFDGTVHFPAWNHAAFREVARERHRTAAPNDFEFSFVTYERRPL